MRRNSSGSVLCHRNRVQQSHGMRTERIGINKAGLMRVMGDEEVKELGLGTLSVLMMGIPRMGI